MTLHDRLREIEKRVAGHTPGPWRVSRKNERKVLGPDNLKIATAVVMSGPTNSRGEDEAIQNAKLMSTAPDLLTIDRELDAENQRLKDIIMAGSKGMGFDEVEMALHEAEKDVDRLTDELQEAVKLCHEARKAISQGRIAVEDEQDMTDWHVQTAPLQARLEQMVARHKEENND